MDNELLNKIKSIKGTYSTDDYFQMLYAKIVKTTPDWATKYIPFFMTKGVQISRKEYEGKIVGYSTEGFLGNYMIVYPDENLVVVRMISWESFRKGEGKTDGSGANNFQNFFVMTRNLIK